MSTEVLIGLGWVTSSFVTGLLGIFIGPWVQYRVFRSHQQGLDQREMIESWLDQGRVTESFAVVAGMRVKEGEEPSFAAIQAIGEHARHSVEQGNAGVAPIPFDPERVHDSKLRRLVDAFGRESRSMMLTLLEVAETGEPRNFDEHVAAAAARCDKLRGQILTILRTYA